MPPAPWLSIAFSDTDLMLQFCLPFPKIITLHQAVPGKQKKVNTQKGCMKYVGVDMVTLCLFVFCRSYKSAIWPHQHYS